MFFLLPSLRAADHSSFLAPAGAADVAERRELFDFDWKFINQEAQGAEKQEYDDRKWQSVDFPHDFAIHGAFDEKAPGGKANGYRPLGVGWYRKSFPTPAGLDGKRVWLEFEGVYRAPKVWVNGELVAEQLNGYVGFVCDITKNLKPAGEVNIVAVRADNTVPETSRWYTGGGIYRHVWLRTAGEIHVVHDGVYVTTPKITTTAAQVKVQTEVRNDSAADSWTTLTTQILDSAGNSVGTGTNVVPIRSGETFIFRQQLEAPTPKLWSTAEPNLYRVVSTVSVDSKPTDRIETSFGIREIQITPNGLFLNGKREFLKGFCIHHDLGCLGAAAFDRAIERHLKTMKEIGCNAIRLSHNPYSSAVLDLCDRMGILVFNEAFDDRSDQFYAEEGAFQAHWAADLEWFVRRDRNHPSVFIWSIANESKDVRKAPDYGVTQSGRMANLVRSLEPTRPVTQAFYPIRWNGESVDSNPPPQAAFLMDVMSANYMEPFFSRDRVKYPQISFISSESATINNGRTAWAKLDRERAVGIFYWGGISYLGESHGWPLKGWRAGFVETTGFRMPGSWDVESYFSSKPMVHLVILQSESTLVWNDVKIASSNLLSHWNFDPQNKETLGVEAYTNCEEVELLLNGKSLGSKKLQGVPGVAPRMVWPVPFQPGELVAVARTGGKEMARYSIKTAGVPASLRLTAESTSLRADGQDLAFVRAEVVDAQGTVVPDAKPRIHFKVTGAGSNAGVDNGDLTSNELFQADERSAHKGRALIVIRSKRIPGEIRLEAEAEGLPATSLTLRAE